MKIYLKLKNAQYNMTYCAPYQNRWLIQIVANHKIMFAEEFLKHHKKIVVHIGIEPCSKKSDHTKCSCAKKTLHKFCTYFQYMDWWLLATSFYLKQKAIKNLFPINKTVEKAPWIQIVITRGAEATKRHPFNAPVAP